MGKGQTLFSVAQNAKAVFERNIDTMVAGFLIRHPDVLPGEIELVMRPGEDRSLVFQIERKGGIQYPEERGVPALADGSVATTYDVGLAEGWNACLQAVKDLNPPFEGEMRSEPKGFGDVEDAVLVDQAEGVISHG